MHGKAQAQSIDAHMGDVLAYIDSLEPPAWPYAVDEALAADGEAMFTSTCARCHGTYGQDETYPGLLVHLDEVGTDPVYAEGFRVEGGLIDWLQGSWFDETADFVAEPGYVAPPLDGIWASAPYFHNASVPDLAGVLDSADRPALFTKEPVYDEARVGWTWTASGAAPRAYDTSIAGFGNGGHTYADGLTAADRTALLEYLKTL
jgi:Cytochrome c